MSGGGGVGGGKASEGPVWSIAAANYKGGMYCVGGDDGCVRVFEDSSERGGFSERHATRGAPRRRRRIRSYSVSLYPSGAPDKTTLTPCQSSARGGFPSGTCGAPVREQPSK